MTAVFGFRLRFVPLAAWIPWGAGGFRFDRDGSVEHEPKDSTTTYFVRLDERRRADRERLVGVGREAI